MKITSYQILAEAWLAAARKGEWEKSETFASLLLKNCQTSLPRLQGLLEGSERELAQTAALMLLGTFLVRNKRLRTATTEGNIEDISRHLRVSVRMCIGYAARRFARERSKEVAILCPDVDVATIGKTVHPRSGQLSFEERYAVALTALDLGVQKRLITAKSETIAKLVLVEGLTHRQIARKLGISPSAVSQQLSRVSAQLRILKDAVEVMIS